MEERVVQLLGMGSDGAEHVEQIGDELPVIFILTCCCFFQIAE